MRFEVEQQDVERIAQRVAEIIKPLLARQKQDEPDTVFDVQGLAAYLHVTPSWVYKQVSLKAIPFFKAGKFPRFRKKDIDRWMETKAVRPIPSLKMVRKRGVAT